MPLYTQLVITGRQRQLQQLPDPEEIRKQVLRELPVARQQPPSQSTLPNQCSLALCLVTLHLTPQLRALTTPRRFSSDSRHNAGCILLGVTELLSTTKSVEATSWDVNRDRSFSSCISESSFKSHQDTGQHLSNQVYWPVQHRDFLNFKGCQTRLYSYTKP